MSKLSFLLSELLRSFRKSIFKDIILMVMFTISVIMAVIMCSHYMDIGERYGELIQKAEGSSWYNIEACGPAQLESYSSGWSTVSGLRKFMDYYEDIRDRECFSMFSVEPDMCFDMKEADFEQHVGSGGGECFLDEGRAHQVVYMFGEACNVVGLKCTGMDLTAYRLFGMRTDEGQDFNEDNFVLDNVTEHVPVILGSNYRKYYKTGDVFNALCGAHEFTCSVIGMLGRETKVPKIDNLYQESSVLDDYIIFPIGISIRNNSRNAEDMEKFAFKDWEALDYGIVRVSDDVKINEVVYDIEEVSDKYDFEPARIVGTPLGIDVLRNESKTTIRVMLMLTIVMALFSFYGMFVTFYDKVQTNGREYGIYLMNGCGIRMILSTYLLEIGLVLCPSLIVSRWLFSENNFGIYYFGPILNAVYILVGFVYLAGAAFVVYVFRGVDIEYLIRGRE